MSVTKQPLDFGYVGDGNTTVFPYLCRALAAADLIVTVEGVAQNLGAHYTLTGLDQANGGTVVFLSAPANNAVVRIQHTITLGRDDDYFFAGAFSATTVNHELDRIHQLIIQLQGGIDRSIKLPADILTDQLLSGNRSNRLVGFDSSGNLALLAASYSIVVQQGAAVAPTVVYADASSGPAVVNLPTSGEVVIIKIDATDNVVTITPTGGTTVCRGTSVDITIQDEAVRLVLQGNNWYRI